MFKDNKKYIFQPGLLINLCHWLQPHICFSNLHLKQQRQEMGVEQDKIAHIKEQHLLLLDKSKFITGPKNFVILIIMDGLIKYFVIYKLQPHIMI